MRLSRFLKRTFCSWKIFLYLFCSFVFLQLFLIARPSPHEGKSKLYHRIKDWKLDQERKKKSEDPDNNPAAIDVLDPYDEGFNLSPDAPYAPSCEVTEKDAQSAISRAKSNQCKQQIADAACKMQNKTLFAKYIPRYCDLPTKHTVQAPMPEEFPVQTTSPVRICYMLVVHGRAYRQLSRLLKLIYDSNHYYYIHVDKRSDYLLRKLKEGTAQYRNVRIAPWQMSTIWGGSSLLQMLLRAMSDVLKIWPDWDYFINLSALDFPIETAQKLEGFLGTHKGKNFMKTHGREDEKFIKKQGLDRVFVECDTHMWRLGSRELPEGITLNGGSDWVALNRDLCNYAVRGKDELLTSLKHWYKYTLLPAESFFHTLTQNSKFCDTFVDNNLRVTNWNRGRGCKCQYKHIVDWCGCSPNDFYPSDLGRLQTARPVFFARKFEESVNQEVVNYLDFKLYGEYPPGTPSLTSYWENVYHEDDDPQKANDPALTHYWSFGRMGVEKLNKQTVGSRANSNDVLDQCTLEMTSLLEVDMYKHNEDFMGYMVTINAKWKTSSGSQSAEAKTVPLQIYTSPIQSLTITDYTSPLSKRLQTAIVGTNWDVKELVLRDWGGIIGPESDVRLACRWTRGEDDFVVTVVVIDPMNVINDYNDFRSPSKSAGVTETPLSLKKPLRPGRWTVRFYVQREFAHVSAELQFSVVPTQFKEGMENHESLQRINKGIEDDANLNAANRNLYSIKTTLNLAKDYTELRKIHTTSLHVNGPELNHWIDETAGKAWMPRELCFVGESVEAWKQSKPDGCSNGNLIDGNVPNLCSHMHWSSFSPDPKSELGEVNSEGRLR